MILTATVRLLLCAGAARAKNTPAALRQEICTNETAISAHLIPGARFSSASTRAERRKAMTNKIGIDKRPPGGCAVFARWLFVAWSQYKSLSVADSSWPLYTAANLPWIFTLHYCSYCLASQDHSV